jgi:hypothetical protein
MVAGLKNVWGEFTRWFQDAWDVIVTAIAKIGETDAVKAELDRMLVEKVGGREKQGRADKARIEAEKQKALGEINIAKAAAHADQDAAFNKAKKEREDELAAAKEELRILRGQAAEKRQQRELEGPKQFEMFEFDGQAIAQRVFGTFSAAAAAAGAAGGSQPIPKKLEDIDKRHERRHREMMRELRKEGRLQA